MGKKITESQLKNQKRKTIPIDSDLYADFKLTLEKLSELTHQKFKLGPRVKFLIEGDNFLMKDFIEKKIDFIKFMTPEMKNDLKFRKADQFYIDQFIQHLKEKSEIFYFVAKIAGFIMVFPELMESIDKFSTENYQKLMQGKSL